MFEKFQSKKAVYPSEPKEFLKAEEKVSHLDEHFKNISAISLKCQQIKAAICDLCHTDCFNKTIETKNWIGKIIWIAFFIVFSGATSWLVILCVLNYFEYELVSKIEVINERPTEFPTKTVFNSNPFTTSFSQDIMANIIDVSFGSESFNNLSYWNAYFEIFNLTYLTKMYVSTYSAFKTKENKSKLGLDLNFHTQNCLFNQIWCSWIEYEDGGGFFPDFNWYYTFDFGNCYQFNSGFNSSGHSVPMKKVYREGKDFGLQIWIGPLLNYNTKYPISESKGLKVFIHNQSFPPLLSQGINVKVGEETNIAVTRTFTHHYPEPFTDCVDLSTSNSELYKYILSLNQTYRQQDCLDLCFQKKVISNCGCYYPKYPMVIKSSPCLNISELLCIFNQYSIFNDANEEKCNMDCPLECETITYEAQISSLDYPSREAFDLLLNAPGGISYNENVFGISFSDFDLYKDSFLIINIFYPSTQFTKLTESPKILPIDLFASIGGTMGIFLGISVYHIVETFEIVFMIIYIFIKK